MKKKEYDYIIVGTGPGGASVAKELSKKNNKILMLEWGNNDPINGSIIQTFVNAGIPGKSLLFTYKMLTMIRGITTGGSSIYYYATAFDPPLNMLKKYGVDVENEIEEAKNELPIAPLKDSLIGPMAKRIMESAIELGYDWKKLNKFVYQNKCRPNCDKCNYGCPYGAKFHSRFLVEDAQNNGTELINNAKVTKVIIENNKACGIEYVKNFVKHKIYANKIIISAGGIGSPVILRNSGIKNAGYNYFFDPLIIAMGEVNDINGGKEFPMACGTHFDDEGYMMTDMTIPSFLFQGFAAEVFRFDRIFSHNKTLTIMIKEKDSLGGHLTNKGGVRKLLAEKDKKALLNGYERAKDILRNAGAKHIFKSWYVAAHPGGTVKINDIVDSNLKTNYDNLYVCDCSVIPESFGLPPTLTLIGLGKRLAKHIEN